MLLCSFNLRCNQDSHTRRCVRFGNGFNYIERFDFITSKLPELESSAEQSDVTVDCFYFSLTLI